MRRGETLISDKHQWEIREFAHKIRQDAKTVYKEVNPQSWDRHVAAKVKLDLQENGFKPAPKPPVHPVDRLYRNRKPPKW
jgi:thymidylate synthase ThyX